MRSGSAPTATALRTASSTAAIAMRYGSSFTVAVIEAIGQGDAAAARGFARLDDGGVLRAIGHAAVIGPQYRRTLHLVVVEPHGRFPRRDRRMG